MSDDEKELELDFNTLRQLNSDAVGLFERVIWRELSSLYCKIEIVEGTITPYRMKTIQK